MLIQAVYKRLYCPNCGNLDSSDDDLSGNELKSPRTSQQQVDQLEIFPLDENDTNKPKEVLAEPELQLRPFVGLRGSPRLRPRRRRPFSATRTSLNRLAYSTSDVELDEQDNPQLRNLYNQQTSRRVSQDQLDEALEQLNWLNHKEKYEECLRLIRNLNSISEIFSA